jgi:hypothetical protein
LAIKLTAILIYLSRRDFFLFLLGRSIINDIQGNRLRCDARSIFIDCDLAPVIFDDRLWWFDVQALCLQVTPMGEFCSLLFRKQRFFMG